MSKPRFWWWKDVKNALRQYPIWMQEWEELKTVSVTPNYSAIGHGSGISNPTEQVALRLLPKRKQEWFDAIREAIAETERRENGTDIIDEFYVLVRDIENAPTIIEAEEG